jgi:hypothetical protein
MITISTTPISEETEEVFELDGTKYYIRKAWPQSYALRMLDLLRTHGDAYATAWALETALGGDNPALQALRDCQTLTAKDMAAVTEVVRLKIMGEAEAEGKD